MPNKDQFMHNLKVMSVVTLPTWATSYGNIEAMLSPEWGAVVYGWCGVAFGLYCGYHLGYIRGMMNR